LSALIFCFCSKAIWCQWLEGRAATVIIEHVLLYHFSNRSVDCDGINVKILRIQYLPFYWEIFLICPKKFFMIISNHIDIGHKSLNCRNQNMAAYATNRIQMGPSKWNMICGVDKLITGTVRGHGVKCWGRGSGCETLDWGRLMNV
jgi:hypothetical protein